ncbi:hypothetical protein [Halovivax cerinus]|uniref:Uncharacterized protein n=1 Tax=Halovivax cerinus TaxID=1487865 RepID=A0ABD5NPD8_9EURY|nr:hypothetical protein [Halovivax cerinus]
MKDVLYEFEEETIPPVVAMAAAALVGLFALGFVYKLVSVLVL